MVVIELERSWQLIMIKQDLSYLSRWVAIIPKLPQHDDAIPIYSLPIHVNYYAIPSTVVCAIIPAASIYPHLYFYLYPRYHIGYRYIIVASTIINPAISITFIVYLIATTFYITAITIV